MIITDKFNLTIIIIVVVFIVSFLRPILRIVFVQLFALIIIIIFLRNGVINLKFLRLSFYHTTTVITKRVIGYGFWFLKNNILYFNNLVNIIKRMSLFF